QNFVIGRLQVKKLDAEPDARFGDAHNDERFKDLTFAREFQPGASVYRQRLARADKASPQGNIGSDPVYLLARLQVDELDICRKGIADGIAPVSNPIEAGRKGRAIWHRNDLRHGQNPGNKQPGGPPNGEAPD